MNIEAKLFVIIIGVCLIISACTTQGTNLPETKSAGTFESTGVDKEITPTATASIEDSTPTLDSKPVITQQSPTPTENLQAPASGELDPGYNETLLLKFNPDETSSIYMEVSPDGKKIAYKRFTAQGQSVIYDGIEYGPYDEAEFITFSPDSEHLVFTAKLGGKMFLVLDGIEQKYYDQVYPPVRFFPEDKIGYQAIQGKNSIVNIGNEEYEYADINSPIYISPNGSSYAFVARNIDAEHFVVRDGIEGKKYDDIEIYNLDLYFSEDGRHLAYIAMDGENWYVVLDENESLPFVASTIDFTFSPNSEHFAYAALTGDHKALFIDGKQIYDYEHTFAPIYSSDSQHFAHKASMDGEVFVVVDGIEGPRHDGTIYGFIFSPDGEHYAYKVDTDDENLFVIDGEIQEVKDVHRPPIYSPDSQHIAYEVYETENDILMLDHEVIDKYNEIKLITFSPDSTHLLAIVEDDETWDDYIVVNGLPGKKYDEILRQIVFENDDTFHYIAIKGDEVFLVTQTID